MIALVTALATCTALLVLGAGSAAGRTTDTYLISRAAGGGIPNGPSTNSVISNDKRFARAIAFESEASNLVGRDTNGLKDVFVVRRNYKIDNNGSSWCPRPCGVDRSNGRTVLASRTFNGQPANGMSFSPALGGAFRSVPKCVGFLSAASNIVRRDTNRQVDAFVANLKGGKPRRISLPGGKQSNAATTAIAVSGDCTKYAFITGGKLYVKSKKRKRPRHLRASGTAADPSFSTGLRNDLVFGASRGVYLSKNAGKRPRLVGRGGRNPVYNDIKRQVVAYEKRRGGHWQIAYHDIGKRERIISKRGGSVGNGDSRKPVIANSGYYVTFESDASNLGTNANGSTDDNNGQPDAYLYTDTRKITLLVSVDEPSDGLPGGGRNPFLSFYANFITFDSPAPLRNAQANPQVWMRWLGAK
jgi:hypothetical protein